MRKETKNRTLSPRDRVKLLDKPVTILNFRVCHALKRWGGVFVHDYFGEGPLSAQRRRSGGGKGVGTMNSEEVTQFANVLTFEDYAAWERIADNDANI